MRTILTVAIIALGIIAAQAQSFEIEVGPHHKHHHCDEGNSYYGHHHRDYEYRHYGHRQYVYPYYDEYGQYHEGHWEVYGD